MKTVKIGDRVLCVNVFGFNNRYPLWNYPKLGGAYTVSDVIPDGCVILAEVDNSHVNAILREFSISENAQFYPYHFIKLTADKVESETEHNSQDEPKY
jgi:hypothetical protein